MPSDQKIVAGAPRIEDYLTAEDRTEFAAIRAVLDGLGIPNRIDDRLVRGLDYYTGTVFEIEDPAHPEFGALGGGGKYAGLVAQLGGPDLEGIGFSYGVDRLLGAAGTAFATPRVSLDAIVIPMAKSPVCQKKASLLAAGLREKGLAVVMPSLAKSAKGAFKMADRLNCRFAVLVNEDLTLELKDLAGRTQTKTDVDGILAALKGTADNA